MFFNFLGVKRVIFERELDDSPKNVPRTLFFNKDVIYITQIYFNFFCFTSSINKSKSEV